MGVSSKIKEFFSNPFNRYLVIGLVALWLVIVAYEGMAQPPAVSGENVIHFFYSAACPHCAAQEVFNEKMKVKYPEVSWAYHEISKHSERNLFVKMAEERGMDMGRLGVPTTFIGNRTIVGFSTEELMGPEIENAIREFIGEGDGGVANETGKKVPEVNLPLVGKISVADYSIPVLAIILGLVDGFNPCGMWTLAYLMALLLQIGDRRRMLLVAGSFVFASGVLYFLYMTAWLNAFLLLGYVRIVMLAVGMVAIGAGVLNIKNYIERKGAMVCEVRDEKEKAETASKIKGIVSAKITLGMVIGVIILAFAVNSFEFVCSFAIPVAFTQMLAISGLSLLEYYAYILVYVLFYAFDDLIVLGLGALLISTAAVQKYAGWCKIIGGVLLLGLGLAMVFAPGLLVIK